MVEERNLPAGNGWKVCDHSIPTIQPESVFRAEAPQNEIARLQRNA